MFPADRSNSNAVRVAAIVNSPSTASLRSASFRRRRGGQIGATIGRAYPFLAAIR